MPQKHMSSQKKAFILAWLQGEMVSIPKTKDGSKSPRKLTLKQMAKTALDRPVLDLPLLDPPPVLSFKTTRP